MKPWQTTSWSMAWWPESIEKNPKLIDDPDFDFDEASPLRIKIEWGLIDQRNEPVAITVRTVRPELTGPISGSILREIPVGRLVAQRRAEQAALSEHRGQWEGQRPRKGREFYEEVAAVYREAYATGAPTKAVKDHYQVNHSTAAKYVARARNQYGLLPRTPQGKAGI